MSKGSLALLLVIICTSAYGASFDCKRAQTTTEKMICGNTELSKADEELCTAFHDAKRKAKRPALLVKKQLEWLQLRNECKEESCLLGEYKERIEFLHNWREYEQTTLPKAGGEVQCTDRPECWPEGSAMHTGLLLVGSLRKASSQLESKHAELIGLLSRSPDFNGEMAPDSRVIAALQAQQHAWMKYRAVECELVGSLTGAGGTWPSTYARECELQLTEERLRHLDQAMRCIQEIPLEDRWMDQANCLQQLAPLANTSQ